MHSPCQQVLPWVLGRSPCRGSPCHATCPEVSPALTFFLSSRSCSSRWKCFSRSRRCRSASSRALASASSLCGTAGRQGWMRQGRDCGDRLPGQLSTALPHIPSCHPGHRGAGLVLAPASHWGRNHWRSSVPSPSIPIFIPHPTSSSPVPSTLPPLQPLPPHPTTPDLSLQPLHLLPLGPCSLLGLSFLLQPPFLLLLACQGLSAGLLLRCLLRPLLLQPPAGRGPSARWGTRAGGPGWGCSTHLSRSSCSRRSRSSRSRCSRAWRRFSASSRAASSRSVVPAGGLPGGVAGTGLGAAGARGAARCTQCHCCSRSPQPRCPPATLYPPAVGSVGTLGVSGRAGGAGLRSSSFLSRAFAWPSCSPRSSRALARTLGEEWVLRGRGGLWGEPRAGLGDAGRALGVAGDEGRFLGPGLQKEQETVLVQLGQPVGRGARQPPRRQVPTCCLRQAGAGAVPLATTAAS